MTREAKVTGWPAAAFILVIFLGLADVIERMVEVVF